MYKTIQDLAAVIFIIGVTLLTIVAILGVWDVLGNDVIYKSLSTIGILTFASLVIIVAAKAMEKHQAGPMA